ncbi:GLPGLI family protein [Emticicia fluvialis]|uniref:GLPGLI family protein n=1 Tax=Emticicia fluvialis TaxID=2974474 RepID=UPI0021662E08|nr:GLPGLI family protein [Emticicia fluvialis]
MKAILKFRFSLVFFALLSPLLGFSQKTEGVVIYERQEFWTKIIGQLTYLSNEEKDRVKQTWGKNDDGWKSKTKLAFNANESLLTNVEEASEYGWSSRTEDYYIYRNFEKEKKIELIEMMGKTYVVEDSLKAPNWKVLNQIKDVAGYICMKAVTEDTVKHQKITAWFTGDIPISAGPERYYGLPGLIMELEINDGDVIITASSVQFKKLTDELKLPKLKGKKIKDVDFDRLIANHIKDSIKSYRNPYWAIKY